MVDTSDASSDEDAPPATADTNSGDADETTNTAETTTNTTETAVEVVETADDVRRKMLDDSKVYIRTDKFTSLLQDEGAEFTDEQKEKLRTKPNSKITKHIVHNKRTYRQLYDLSNMVWIKLGTESYGAQYFPRLTSTKTNGVHGIGSFIAKNRVRVSRGDFQTHQSPELQAMLTHDDYKDKDVLYYLSQREILTHCFGKWGVDNSAKLKPDVDDKLRLLGILLTFEEMREYIPDILNKRRDSEKGWQSLDAAPGRARNAWTGLLKLFCNENVVVDFPEKWSAADFKQRINDRSNDSDFYDTHCKFNPNNKERIKLPWDKTSLKSVLKDGKSDYDEMMKTYTMGTGGGSGAPEDFADWWNRDESWILNYTPQQAQSVYLAIVFMWDKLHNFPFSPPCQKMPPGCGREDEAPVDGSTPIAAAPKANKSDTVVLKAFKELSAQRADTTKKLLEAIQGKDDSADEEDDSANRAAMIQRIANTRELKVSFEQDLRKLRKKRDRVEDKYAADEEKQAKKLKRVDVDIGDCKSMIQETAKTLRVQLKELRELNNVGAKQLQYKNGSESSSSSDDSDSEDDD
jgi:hypothetical protein